MWNIFRGPAAFFKKLFKHGPEGFMNMVERVAPIVNVAYPVVKQIALMTPTKADDAILAVCEKYGVEFNASADKGAMLRDAAKAEITRQLGGSPLSNYLINTAIEMAYAKLKEESQAKS